MQIPDDLGTYVTPWGVWYYLQLRRHMEVGQTKRLTFKRLKVNRVSGTKNNWLLEKFGFIRVEQGRGKRNGNTYTILK